MRARTVASVFGVRAGKDMAPAPTEIAPVGRVVYWSFQKLMRSRGCYGLIVGAMLPVAILLVGPVVTLRLPIDPGAIRYYLRFSVDLQ